MPGFLRGQVPNPNYEREDVNQFSQISEFTNDVYVYGTLYADIFAKDIDFGDEVEFTDLKVNRNFTVIGLSTFIDAVDMDYLTVYQQHNVGTSGTVFVAISSTSDLSGVVGGRVGIGTTQPDNRLQVGTGDTSFNVTDLGLVGIGTTQPVAKFQVGQGSDSFVVTGIGTVGIGTTSVGGDWTVGNVNYDGSTQGELKLDIDGSVHIGRNIYDSAGSPGANGFFLNRDEVGVRWVAFEPAFTEGVFVQDEGVYIPQTGIAQSFTVFNYKQINSFGTGVDNLIPIPNPSNPTQIVDIQTKDFWGFNGNNIYRMSNVGINNNSPASTLDISGTVHATGAVDFDSTLNVDSNVTFNATLDLSLIHI